MTDLSEFEGHTKGPWNADIYTSDCEVYANILVNDDGDDASEVDLKLMNAAPALLARVKELEEALAQVVHLPQAMRDSVDGEDVFDMAQAVLEKEWL